MTPTDTTPRSGISAGRWSHLWYGDDPDNRWVLPVAVGVVALQLVYRAWASYGSWWSGDDFIFIARVFGPGGVTLPNLLANFAGHVMPADFYVTWLMTKAAPFDYTLPATGLVVMQALAGAGLLRMLWVGFGRRWGIIPPLVLYGATSFTVESSLWWATGVQALPLQIAFFWAMSSQLTYLRTRRARSAIFALLWVAFGLAFYEKTILVIGALAIVTVAYFTTGTARERVHQLWSTYRVSVVANLVLGVAYLALYIHYGLNFAPTEATRTPIGPTADVMILRGWGPALLGGPLTWRHDDPNAPISFAAPRAIVVLLAWVVLILLLREVARSRLHALRALWLPAFFLISDVLLVVASRASIIGPIIGYEYRYITELSAVTAVALALATMPVRGALEPVTTRRPSVFLDRRRPVLTACVAVAVLGTYSTAVYITSWHGGLKDKSYVSNLVSDVQHLPPGTKVVDTPVPTDVVLSYTYPNNLLSRLMAPIDSHLDFVTSGTDDLRYLGPDGHLGKLTVTPVHHAVPRSGQCPYPVGPRLRTIKLDGPFAFGGWWVRVGYIATADSAITVSAGGLTQQASISSGLHALYFMAGPQRFESIRIGGLIGDARLCTADVTVGRATVVGSQGASTP